MAPLPLIHFLTVGAGAAGLMTARELARAGKKVTILEARERTHSNLRSRCRSVLRSRATTVLTADQGRWSRRAGEAARLKGGVNYQNGFLPIRRRSTRCWRMGPSSSGRPFVRTDIDEKVLEKLATSDKATIVIERQLDGKMRMTSGSWDGVKVILPDQALEVHKVDGRLHIAR